MNAFVQLLDRNPLVFTHLVCALLALGFGIVLLNRRKGNGSHRAIGWVWVVAMGGAALTSAFIRDHGMPNLAGITPIHILTAVVAINLPRAVLAARRHDVAAHRRAMRGMFFGGCAVAGLFTLLPGRFLGHLLWTGLLG
jgi:uncharacterized membrane protein